MKIISGCKGAGKTTELLRLAIENHAVLVLPTDQQCVCLKLQAAELGNSIPDPITYRQFLIMPKSVKDLHTFIVDDIDGLLADLGEGKVIAYSVDTEGDISSIVYPVGPERPLWTTVRPE
jgi:hypothetical protein